MRGNGIGGWEQALVDSSLIDADTARESVIKGTPPLIAALKQAYQATDNQHTPSGAPYTPWCAWPNADAVASTSHPRDSAVNVLHWIIPKGTLWKNTLASDVILLGGSIPHVTCRPALSARHAVLLRPVLMIMRRTLAANVSCEPSARGKNGALTQTS